MGTEVEKMRVNFPGQLNRVGAIVMVRVGEPFRFEIYDDKKNRDGRL